MKVYFLVMNSKRCNLKDDLKEIQQSRPNKLSQRLVTVGTTHHIWFNVRRKDFVVTDCFYFEKIIVNYEGKKYPPTVFTSLIEVSICYSVADRPNSLKRLSLQEAMLFALTSRK